VLESGDEVEQLAALHRVPPLVLVVHARAQHGFDIITTLRRKNEVQPCVRTSLLRSRG
jgi:hypothetical protein